MTLLQLLRKNVNKNSGLAASIRLTTTFSPRASLNEMIAAGNVLGLNAATIRTQFYQARREDAEMDRAQAAWEQR